jgi:hypothetical protein
LYGTIEGSGDGSDFGWVFKVAAGGTESTLYSFKGDADGQNPTGAPAIDASGNLFGTTGGSFSTGTIYELAPDGTETVLNDFLSTKHGGYAPLAGVILDQSGNLYGTTSRGGSKGGWPGVMFKFTR